MAKDKPQQTEADKVIEAAAYQASKSFDTEERTQTSPFGEFDVPEAEADYEAKERAIYEKYPTNVRIRAFDRMLVNYYIEEGWIMEWERLSLLEELVSGSANKVDRFINWLLMSRLGMLMSPWLLKISRRISHKIDDATSEDELIEQANRAMLNKVIDRVSR